MYVVKLSVIPLCTLIHVHKIVPQFLCMWLGPSMLSLAHSFMIMLHQPGLCLYMKLSSASCPSIIFCKPFIWTYYSLPSVNPLIHDIDMFTCRPFVYKTLSVFCWAHASLSWVGHWYIIYQWPCIYTNYILCIYTVPYMYIYLVNFVFCPCIHVTYIHLYLSDSLFSVAPVHPCHE